MLVISCHADTGFDSCWLKRLGAGVMEGHLDNYTGVYSVMKAFFSGRLNQDYIRIELTYGEEDDFEGARAVRRTLRKHDLVLVVDVTGTPTAKDFVIEKCRNQALRGFLTAALSGLSFDIYEGCPDPVACEDEVDIYSRKCDYVCFLGVPCFGGDYNAGPVRCREKSLECIAEAICKIAEDFPEFCKRSGIPVGHV